jgi:hypothetical protein
MNYLQTNHAIFDCVHDVCAKLPITSSLLVEFPFVGVGDFRQVAPVVKGQGPNPVRG